MKPWATPSANPEAMSPTRSGCFACLIQSSRYVRSGSLSSGHARALLNYPNPEVLVDQILKQGMSVRQTEMLVAKKIAARGVVRRPRAEKLDVADMERRVSDVLGCRVSITTNRKGGGELSIRFGDLYQLEELVDRLVGDHATTSLSDARRLA